MVKYIAFYTLRPKFINGSCWWFGNFQSSSLDHSRHYGFDSFKVVVGLVCCVYDGGHALVDSQQCGGGYCHVDHLVSVMLDVSNDLVDFFEEIGEVSDHLLWVLPKGHDLGYITKFKKYFIFRNNQLSIPILILP